RLLFSDRRFPLELSRELTRDIKNKGRELRLIGLLVQEGGRRSLPFVYLVWRSDAGAAPAPWLFAPSPDPASRYTRSMPQPGIDSLLLRNESGSWRLNHSDTSTIGLKTANTLYPARPQTDVF